MLDLQISCLEIYQEHVFDLFAEEKGVFKAEYIHITVPVSKLSIFFTERLPLQVREHAAEGFYLEGCKMIECTNLDSGYKTLLNIHKYSLMKNELFCYRVTLIENAMRNRQTGGHDLNNRSSSIVSRTYSSRCPRIEPTYH